ncbi:hypothetical protein HX017_15375 [Myroides marinus]|uniref:hypothetical protein n=1 Tax=Myroides marinus TaxID=703342 RepID=UPI0025786403|nr:hypothetical protein [Myroides marinus]MDM1366321.1 hypothetical protein [Myroides marinus]
MSNLKINEEYLLEQGFKEINADDDIIVKDDSAIVDVELWLKCDMFYPFEVMDQVYVGKTLNDLKENVIKFYKEQDYNQVTIKKVFVKYGSKTED